MAIDAIWTGFRPSSIDDAPIIGETQIPGLVLATGHHRNGYLLAPVTAFAIESLIADGALPAVARPFGLDRFGGAAGQTGEPVKAKQVGAKSEAKSEYETGFPQ
jgi:glycine oxidase